MKDPDGEEEEIPNQVRHFTSLYISGVFDRMQNDGVREVDLRSDTVTKPTKEMRDALWPLLQLVTMFMVMIRL